MSDLTDMIIANSRQQDRLHSEFSLNTTSTFSYLNLSNEIVRITNPYTILNERIIGSSFILDHPIFGKLGVIAQVGSKPYLGDSRGAYVKRSVSSPNNIFIEKFNGSRFNSSTSTADWAIGSCYFTSGERIVTETLYLGSRIASYIEINLTGSTVENLYPEASANATTYELVSSSSIYPHYFSNSGSNVTFRLTENIGSQAMLTEFKVKVGF